MFSFTVAFDSEWPNHDLLFFPEAFAVVREAARRKLGMRHFDVQVFSLSYMYL